ncbi:hypothetical protein [Halobacterium litoreum]|uniref:SPW repeat-containing protein n=1 Tax=Halobacterium litoreum TaxID=2039234 RepID=A0ABD5NGC8_9EURY|nr:hypothetical protein [Halobacterium litoreum]UHH13040.1 hypothetical protein LT972_12860 [Halobacterium litoreum]
MSDASAGRRWTTVAAVILGFAGAGMAAPPDPITQVVFLPVVAAAALPACVWVAVRAPGGSDGSGFAVFVVAAAVVGGAAVEAASLVPFDFAGLLSLVAFVGGVYLAAAAARKRFGAERTAGA